MFTTKITQYLKTRFRPWQSNLKVCQKGVGFLMIALLFIASSPLQTPNIASPLMPEHNQELVKTITLTHLASQSEYAKLLIQFNRAGINVTNNSKIKKKFNWLKELKFQLMHNKGMNFKLKITGFRKLEFRFVFDEQKQFQYFTYRINDEDVYQQILTDTKGFKSYVCFDTGIVQRGETNNDIERFN